VCGANSLSLMVFLQTLPDLHVRLLLLVFSNLESSVTPCWPASYHSYSLPVPD
jgi:hypothetical protein